MSKPSAVNVENVMKNYLGERRKKAPSILRRKLKEMLAALGKLGRRRS